MTENLSGGCGFRTLNLILVHNLQVSRSLTPEPA